MKLSLPPKFRRKKLVLVPVISFCKIFILSYPFDALLCRNLWGGFMDNSIMLEFYCFVLDLLNSDDILRVG
jgi:hypothetical protein